MHLEDNPPEGGGLLHHTGRLACSRARDRNLRCQMVTLTTSKGAREAAPRNSNRPDTATRGLTHSCAMPALRTADEMALTAVQSEFSSWVISPVPRAFLPSSMTKRVRVLISVSKGAWSAIAGTRCRCRLLVLAASADR